HAGRGVVALQILLHDEATHGMADDHGRAGQLLSSRSNILDIVAHRTSPKRLVRWALAVATKAQCDCAVTLVGKVAEEILVPTPSGVPGPVDKEKRNWMRLAHTALLDDL